MTKIEILNNNLQKDLLKHKFCYEKIVFGNGETDSKIVMIGEAPGGEEEKVGKPFVGKAGKNLEEFLEIVGLERRDIYITNVVKIRPFKLSPKTNKPVNRAPNKEEIDFFKPFLKEELAIISPKVIVTLGNFALRAVMEEKTAEISKYHGKEYSLDNGSILFPLYHPAAIIYDRKLKEVYLRDLEILSGVI